MVAFAEVLDQLSGIECYSGTAVGLHLQKFWISFAEVNVMMTLEWHFWRPESVKLALERRLEQPCGAKLPLERRLEQPCGAKLALERRLAAPGTPENEVKSPWRIPRPEAPARNLWIDDQEHPKVHETFGKTNFAKMPEDIQTWPNTSEGMRMHPKRIQT